MDTPKLTAETKGLCLGGTHRIDVVECQSSYHLVLALGHTIEKVMSKKHSFPIASNETCRAAQGQANGDHPARICLSAAHFLAAAFLLAVVAISIAGFASIVRFYYMTDNNSLTNVL